MTAYALTIFAGAFLLFQVQPLIGKYILPWFGGGPGVWTTCMLFFQVLLLGGYAYAHFTSRWLKPCAQAALHLVLLAAALALLPITPSDSWKPHGGGNPTLQILALLAISLGLPYFVLSTTGPLLQQWFTRAKPGTSPYRLYALSNVGSLLALVSYPFFFETHFSRKAQASLWAWGLVAYVLCCGFCALRLWKADGHSLKSKVQSPKPEGVNPEAETGSRSVPSTPSLHHSSAPPSPTLNPRPSTLNYLLWLLLPGCASVLLLATTNKLCQDVAVIPFLWVVPLALYLFSFIICFDSPRWYVRFPFTVALIAAMVSLCWALYNGADLLMFKQVALYCSALFVCCMVCHGELYRLKPDPSHLTAFYLMIAAGGALGGIFVAIAAPLLFTDYYELHWGLFLCALLFLVVCATDRAATGSMTDPDQSSVNPTWRWMACALAVLAFAGLDQSIASLQAHTKAVAKGYFIGLRVGMWALLVLGTVSWIARRKFSRFRYWQFLACAWLFLGAVTLGATLWMQARSTRSDRVYRSRNFYGVLTVYEHEKNLPLSHYFLLQHGRITHGLQFADPFQATWPISYYGKDSGIWLAVDALPAGHRRIGVVGLGTGTMAAFGRPGDYLRFYEINPQVHAVATSWFTYLPKCPGAVEVAPGDARLSLEQEPPQHFDLLVLDAFSSDAIPVHLLTKEAFETYERHLNTNAIIAVHISNHYLNLEPVVINLARQFGYKLASIDYEEADDDWWLYGSTWVLLSRSAEVLNRPAIRDAASVVNTNSTKVPLWTDDFASLFQILR
jgi:hypothetical protein